MVRSLSWIEPEDVQRALAKVASPSPRTASTTHGKGPSTASRPRSPRPPTGAPSTGPLKTTLPDLHGAANAADGVSSLAQWVDGSLRPSRWFLADAEGFVLYEKGCGERLVAETVGILRDLQHDQVSSLRVRDAEGEELDVQWVATRVGPVALGIEHDRSRDAGSAVAVALGPVGRR